MTGPSEEEARETYGTALSLLAAGLAGDTGLADLIYESAPDKRELFAGLVCITAAALRVTGTDPAEWVAALQAAHREHLAGGD